MILKLLKQKKKNEKQEMLALESELVYKPIQIGPNEMDMEVTTSVLSAG